MHIVHVEDFFHPDAGYQLNLLSRLQVAQGHRITIVAAKLEKVPGSLTSFFGKDNIGLRDRAFEEVSGTRIVRLPVFGFYSGRALFNPLQLIRTVSSLKPDATFVHGEDTLTGMIFIRLAARLSYPLVLDCHMLEMASENRFREQFRSFYRRFITPVILREQIPLIRVVDSNFVEKCLGIPLSHTKLLSFGTDTTHFKPSAAGRSKVRAEHGIDENAFLVLYAGKLDESKGGQFLADSIREKFNTSRPINIMVIGTTDGEYGEKVNATLTASKNRIVRLPTQRYFDLADYYQAADLAIYPKQCSMSFFEAQSCGLPILFEDNEINRQRVVGGNAYLFASGDVADFRSKVEELCGLSTDQWVTARKKSREYILQTYDYVPIAQQFTDVITEAADRWRKARH